MKIVSLSFLIVSAAASAWSCDLCSVYSANQAHGERGKGFFAGVGEQYTHFGTMQMDGVEVPNTVDQHLDSVISQVLIGYNFNDKFGLQLNTPFIYRSFRRPDGFAIDEGTEAGVGDISLLGNWRVLRLEEKNSTFLWNVLGGVKMPTGSSDRIYEEVLELTAPPPPVGAPDSGIHGHDLALGSGSFDGLIGTGVFGRYKRAFLTANVQYSIRSTGDFDYRYANDLMWSGGPGAYVLLNEEHTISLQLIVSGEHKGKDTFQGMNADDTGVTAVYLGPQINFSWSDHLSAEIGADFPVSIQNTDLQTVPDYRVRGGLTWHF
ncbi:MAG: hypothetical protein JWM68_3368 [Verrucomicrobiales bacterium]|nr:hypothetical protein [Verrucomicrobiales bacterium]